MIYISIILFETSNLPDEPTQMYSSKNVSSEILRKFIFTILY